MKGLLLVLDTHDTLGFCARNEGSSPGGGYSRHSFFALVRTLLVFVLWWVVNRLLKPPQWRLARRFGQWEGRGGGSFSHTTWPQNPQVFLKVITSHTASHMTQKDSRGLESPASKQLDPLMPSTNVMTSLTPLPPVSLPLSVDEFNLLSNLNASLCHLMGR